MQILLRQAKIIDSSSPFNGQTKDILISDGIISSIEDKIEQQNAQVVAESDLLVSGGWVDPFSHFCDPGIEYKETTLAYYEANYYTEFAIHLTN
jgi:dihydroorotase